MKRNKEIEKDNQTSIVDKFNTNVRCFKIGNKIFDLDCNRVSKKVIEIVFP